MKRATTAVAALVVLAGCASPSDRGPKSRNLTYGLFYETFRPESSRQAEEAARASRRTAPEIDESYDVGKIRAARTSAESAEDRTLSDWKDGVLLRADASLLRTMRRQAAGRVEILEARLARISGEPVTLQKGRIEPVRRELEVEKFKLDEIDARLAQIE